MRGNEGARFSDSEGGRSKSKGGRMHSSTPISSADSGAPLGEVHSHDEFGSLPATAETVLDELLQEGNFDGFDRQPGMSFDEPGAF